MRKTMRNEYTGATRMVKTGFSWTTLFFGCFPALFRGDLKWALIMILCGVLTAGLSLVVFPFIYNRKYIEELQMQGFKFVDHTDTYKRSDNQFYKSAWFMYFLFFVFPPLGILDIWVNNNLKYSTKKKVLLSAFFGIVFIILISK